MIPLPLREALAARKTALIRQLEWDFREIARIADRAFAEHQAGNLSEARILLNQALDIEYKATGDCQLLGPTAEQWDVVFERDRRKPTP